MVQTSTDAYAYADDSGTEVGGSVDFSAPVAYAVERCGFLVTRHNRSMFSAAELKKWDKALASYATAKLATRGGAR